MLANASPSDWAHSQLPPGRAHSQTAPGALPVSILHRPANSACCQTHTLRPGTLPGRTGRTPGIPCNYKPNTEAGALPGLWWQRERFQCQHQLTSVYAICRIDPHAYQCCSVGCSSFPELDKLGYLLPNRERKATGRCLP